MRKNKTGFFKGLKSIHFENVDEKGPHIKADKFKGGPHGRPYKPRDLRNHTGCPGLNVKPPN